MVQPRRNVKWNLNKYTFNPKKILGMGIRGCKMLQVPEGPLNQKVNQRKLLIKPRLQKSTNEYN